MLGQYIALTSTEQLYIHDRQIIELRNSVCCINCKHDTGH